LLNNNIDFEKYAKKSIDLKGISQDRHNVELASNSLREAFGTTYHAVALDVDGTVTEDAETGLNQQIVKTLSCILDLGVYVIFITGGGKNTAMEIINKLKDQNKNKKRWRVYAITGSGCELLSLETNGNIKEEAIAKPLSETVDGDTIDRLLQDLRKTFGSYFEITQKSCGIRLVAKMVGQNQDLENSLVSWSNSWDQSFKKTGIKPIKGRWKDRLTFDITYTDKDWALTYFYTSFDFMDIPILRIGDQGGVAGNDYFMLDSVFGFSVGTLGPASNKCFPILNVDDSYESLFGVRATNFILNHVNWAPRITIPSFLVAESLPSYISALKERSERAKSIQSIEINKWCKSSKGLLSDGEIELTKISGFSNVFDNKSGGVWLSEDEWRSINEYEIGEIFKCAENGSTEEPPKLLRSLFLDKGVLLRGPKYYPGLSYQTSKDVAKLIYDECIFLLEVVLDQVPPSETMDTLICWKLKLAILDNLKNTTLLLYSMLFDASSLESNSRPFWKRLLQQFEKFTYYSISAYYSMLTFDTQIFKETKVNLRMNSDILYSLKNSIALLYEFLENKKVDKGKIIRKWREVDHPGQILLALKSVEDDLRNQVSKDEKILAIGLMYGGVELPFAFQHVFKGKFENRIFIANLGGISFYRKGQSPLMGMYEKDLLESAIADVDDVYKILGNGVKAILLDDNFTTGRTAELAYDRLISYGINVPFIMCVRYPPEHRVKQMEMRAHGGVDPFSIGKEIKGLVSRSPYSRIFSSESHKYKDKSGKFDLSRDRIERYLKKNGIFMTDDSI
jgi:pyrimidine operon attenuation protein/uracil phosphoribosyltransferase